MRLSKLRSVLITGVLWIYFAGLFVAGYWLIIVLAGIVGGRRAVARRLSHYLRLFLRLTCLLVRGLRIEVPERAQLQATAGSVVVCNHISFLDPLLLLSLIPEATTVVRPDFFRVPFFGWLIAGAGFLKPSLFAEGQPWIETIARHLRSGGNLLIFPEGTRSRDGRLSQFKKGAFYLARHLEAPIVVLRVAGTDGVFPPGQWVLSPAVDRPIELRLLGRIEAADVGQATTHELTERVFEMVGDR